jgi:hypothetical protein
LLPCLLCKKANQGNQRYFMEGAFFYCNKSQGNVFVNRS